MRKRTLTAYSLQYSIFDLVASAACWLELLEKVDMT